jgi:hypothetical protein|tara:strand:+ start:981 stop:1142 length:162 start_codon:yes stop_codon:yes gene_type:complete
VHGKVAAAAVDALDMSEDERSYALLHSKTHLARPLRRLPQILSATSPLGRRGA